MLCIKLCQIYEETSPVADLLVGSVLEEREESPSCLLCPPHFPSPTVFLLVSINRLLEVWSKKEKKNPFK